MSALDIKEAATHLAEWMYSLPFQLDEDATIACYLPLHSEPGSNKMLAALTNQGYRVIVPVIPKGPPQPLCWAVYDNSEALIIGRWGVSVPKSPTLYPEALLGAEVVFVPALAVSLTGVRLGKGRGYYDRSLPNSTALRIAIVYDSELVNALPAESHDVPMNWALTPRAGFIRLGV